MGEFLRKNVSRRLLALGEGEIVVLTTSMRQIGVGTPGGAEALAIFHQLLYDEWMTGTAGQNQSRREKLLWDDRMEGGARRGIAGRACGLLHCSGSPQGCGTGGIRS